ncbi:TetR/AcrR family transcriptional regulator [Nonomuraea sp. NPDC050790]|uniref:TetR/AcrR family transcriptional regulator n=1 Tax=Nonomuraea sp. NPDC050790 TaxID=3364371 RepID=UPI0037A38F40
MREDTRSRIQQIALRLFTEQGYEATSLREIAEELGVTKAALYYHFKTKDDIVASLADDRVAEIEELLDWLRSQPRTPETRRELIIRYAERLDRPRQAELARFLERNQTALRDHPKILRMREKMLEVVAELVEPGDPLTTRLRRTLAMFSLHAGLWLTQDVDASPEERRKATLEVAISLLEP